MSSHDIGAAVIATLWIARELVAQLSKNRRSAAHVTLGERELLSLDERSFRAEILHELAGVKTELAKCKEAHSQAVVARQQLGTDLAGTQRELTETRAELDKTTRLLERVRTSTVAGTIVLDPEGDV